MGTCRSTPGPPRGRGSLQQDRLPPDEIGSTTPQLLCQPSVSIFSLSFDDQNAAYLDHKLTTDRVPLVGFNLTDLLSLHSNRWGGTSGRLTNKMFAAADYWSDWPVPYDFAARINSMLRVPPVSFGPVYMNKSIKLVFVGDFDATGGVRQATQRNLNTCLTNWFDRLI